MSLILSGTDGLSDVDGTAATPAIRGTDTNTGIFFPAADTVAASVGGTEGLRLTTTGLGVGTSTPNSIGGNSNARYFGLAGDGTLSSADGRVILSNPRAYASIVANSTTAGRIYFQLPNASTGTTNEAAFIDSIASGSGGTSGYGIDIRFGPKADNGSANERMRLDQAGNLGLGVTPSAWFSSAKVFQIGNGLSLWSSGNTNAALSQNLYLDATATYRWITANPATNFNQSNGAFTWQLAAGTPSANGAIGAFTTHMTLDATGNLGLGVTPSAWASGWKAVETQGGSLVAPTSGFLDVVQNAYYDGAWKYKNTAAASIYYQNAGAHYWTTAPSGTAGNAISFTQAMTLTSGGDLLVGVTAGTGSWHHITKGSGQGQEILSVIGSQAGSQAGTVFFGSNTITANTAATVIRAERNSSTSRSINAGGTINASGADYAEYMTKAGDFTIAKGDVCGIDANGKLTNVFADAVSFCVKSTDPSYVGGDSWGAGFEDDAEGLEAARQKVDRIAFAGQVPVNVMGATPGQYIVPVNDNGAIKGIPKNEADMTLAEYMKAVGKVIATQADGRAFIIVKVA